jgi:hypothetical protein
VLGWLGCQKDKLKVKSEQKTNMKEIKWTTSLHGRKMGDGRKKRSSPFYFLLRLNR